MIRIESDGLIHFQALDPCEYDWLREIQWIAKPICKKCGELKENEIGLDVGIYDGLHWVSPKCMKCGETIQGCPENTRSRKEFFRVRPYLKESSNNFEEE